MKLGAFYSRRSQKHICTSTTLQFFSHFCGSGWECAKFERNFCSCGGGRNYLKHFLELNIFDVAFGCGVLGTFMLMRGFTS